jgi:uncharacterized LabA/DUF88 family protein
MDKKEAIVFIDGNNFYHNLKSSFINPGDINIQKVSELVAKHFNFEIKRTIYYNSVPSIADSEKVYYAHMKFLDGIRKLENFEVKTRKLQRLSTKEKLQVVQNEISALGLCKSCKPVVISHWKDYVGSINVKEKGVDTMIVVDMLHLSLIDKECDACILVSGDSDFAPCLELLRTKDIWIGTASLAKGYAYELRDKFPWFILDKDWLKSHCSKK